MTTNRERLRKTTKVFLLAFGLVVGLLAIALVGLHPARVAAFDTWRIGSPVPSFRGKDLAGVVRNSREIVGRPTFVLAITDSDAGESARQWGDTARRRLPPRTSRLHLVALDLAFIVPTETFLSAARNGTPRSLWSRTWADRNDELRLAIGLPESETPFAFAVDAQGIIVARAHCEVTDPAAEQVWSAF